MVLVEEEVSILKCEKKERVGASYMVEFGFAARKTHLGEDGDAVEESDERDSIDVLESDSCVWVAMEHGQRKCPRDEKERCDAPIRS